jgi:hypothetical protein
MQLTTIRKLLTKMADPSNTNKVLTHALGLSSLSYFSDKFITTQLTKLNMPFKILSYKDMKCVIAESDTSVYIAFRGTEPTIWSNWKRLLNIIPKDFINGLKAHGGFELYFKEYQQYIDLYLKSIVTKKQIIFTGHSLGAAVSSLYNISYNQSSYSITFASPNYLFEEKFDSASSTSYRIKKDFITWIPFSIPYYNWYRSANTVNVKSIYSSINLLDYHSLDNYINSILTY